MVDSRHVGDGIREFVFGANDGAVSTFAILSGLVGAGLASPLIALVGVVQMVAAGLSMGLGAYISTKSQNEYYGAASDEQLREIDVHPAREKARVRSFLSERGLSGRTLSSATGALTVDKRGWLRFLLEARYGIAETSYPHPVIAGFVMFGAFLVAGFFPVAPFFFFSAGVAIFYSAVLSLLLLFFVGAAKTRFTRRNTYLSGLENLLIGAVTGVVGFCVGLLVQGLL